MTGPIWVIAYCSRPSSARVTWQIMQATDTIERLASRSLYMRSLLSFASLSWCSPVLTNIKKARHTSSYHPTSDTIQTGYRGSDLNAFGNVGGVPRYQRLPRGRGLLLSTSDWNQQNTPMTCKHCWPKSKYSDFQESEACEVYLANLSVSWPD